MGLYHPLDGVTNPKYKLLCSLTAKKSFRKEKKALAFNQYRCCHLALCLQLILFHWLVQVLGKLTTTAKYHGSNLQYISVHRLRH
jgi:hypothetical protein